MNLECIKKVLEHCYKRQIDSGPESAFRFALILGPLRKQFPSSYPDADNPSPPPANIPSRSKEKGKERQVDRLDSLIRLSKSPSSYIGDELPNDPIRTEEGNQAGLDPGPAMAVGDDAEAHRQEGLITLSQSQGLLHLSISLYDLS
jgi:hypothetical protein